MASPKSSNGLVPLADAGMELAVSHTVAYRLLLSGALKGKRVGRNWFVTIESLRQYEKDSAAIAGGPIRIGSGQ